MEDPASHEAWERQVHLFVVKPAPGERKPVAFLYLFHGRAGRGNPDRFFRDLGVDLNPGFFPDPDRSRLWRMVLSQKPFPLRARNRR